MHKLILCLGLLPISLWSSVQLPGLPTCLDSNYTLTLKPADSRVKIQQHGHLWFSKKQGMLRFDSTKPQKGIWLISKKDANTYPLVWVDHGLKQVIHQTLKPLEGDPLLTWLLSLTSGDMQDYHIRYHHDAHNLYVSFIPDEDTLPAIDTTWHKDQLIEIRSFDAIRQQWILTLDGDNLTHCPLPDSAFQIRIPAGYDQTRG